MIPVPSRSPSQSKHPSSVERRLSLFEVDATYPQESRPKGRRLAEPFVLPVFEAGLHADEVAHGLKIERRHS